MTDTETANAIMADGFTLLMSQARIIAMLPLEDWRAALDRAETIAAVTDPTLYREYIWSEKPVILKRIIDAALPLKRAVLQAQEAVIREMQCAKQ